MVLTEKPQKIKICDVCVQKIDYKDTKCKNINLDSTFHEDSNKNNSQNYVEYHECHHKMHEKCKDMMVEYFIDGQRNLNTKC